MIHIEAMNMIQNLKTEVYLRKSKYHLYQFLLPQNYTNDMTARLEKSLKGFHYRAVRKMSDMVPKRQWYGTWLYTPIGAALEMVRLE